jgi:hypothetical protein
MFATGLRAVSLATELGNRGLSFNEQGVFVGGIPLLTRRPGISARDCWAVRPLNEINEDLTTLYRVPVDVGSKAGALALIAKALNTTILRSPRSPPHRYAFPIRRRLRRPLKRKKRLRAARYILIAAASSKSGIRLSILGQAHHRILAGSRRLKTDQKLPFRLRWSKNLGISRTS